MTKYYFAGTQRIATLAPHCVRCSAGVRKGGVLTYMLTDHLGSTSLITDASGAVLSETRYTAWGEVRYQAGTTSTGYTYTGQYSDSYINLLDYGSRRYDPELGRFIQPDSIIPGASNPQAYDRYSYVFNNPVKYTDPSGHKPCDGDYNEKGHCDDSNYKLLDLIDYVEGEIVNENGKIRNKYTSLEAMGLVIKKAASIYGRDWNGFLDATTYIFTGYYGHGSEAMLKAHQSDFSGYFDGASGFHPDFKDKSNQVRHFWAAFATAANPYGDNPNGGESATFGNWVHDIATDGFGNDGATVMDYELSITGIDIAAQVGNEIKTPFDLAGVLLYRLGVEGSGYTGPYVNPARWITPWD